MGGRQEPNASARWENVQRRKQRRSIQERIILAMMVMKTQTRTCKRKRKISAVRPSRASDVHRESAQVRLLYPGPVDLLTNVLMRAARDGTRPPVLGFYEGLLRPAFAPRKARRLLGERTDIAWGRRRRGGGRERLGSCGNLGKGNCVGS